METILILLVGKAIYGMMCIPALQPGPSLGPAGGHQALAGRAQGPGDRGDRHRPGIRLSYLSKSFKFTVYLIPELPGPVVVAHFLRLGYPRWRCASLAFHPANYYLHTAMAALKKDEDSAQ